MKIHATNIEASKFVCFLSVMENYSKKDFPNVASMYMLLLQPSYIFISFASESRVVRNTILIQRDVLWTGKI